MPVGDGGERENNDRRQQSGLCVNTDPKPDGARGHAAHAQTRTNTHEHAQTRTNTHEHARTRTGPQQTRRRYGRHVRLVAEWRNSYGKRAKPLVSIMLRTRNAARRPLNDRTNRPKER